MARPASLLAASAVALFAISPLASAVAGHDTPVYCAAERYREAVRDFERHVLKTDYVARCDERLVDDLEDSTSRLRSAARDLHRLDRLFKRFAETDVLHGRVQLVLFGQGLYPPNPYLESCWRAVAHAHALLVEEMNCLKARLHSGHGHAVGRIHHASPRPPVVYAPPAVYGRPVGTLSRPAIIDPPLTPAARPPARRPINTRDQLRQAVIAAMLGLR